MFFLGFMCAFLILIYLGVGFVTSIIAEHDGGIKWILFWPFLMLYYMIKYRE